MHLIMTSLKQEDIKNLFNKEFDFVSNVLNQVKLPVRIEDSGKINNKISIFTSFIYKLHLNFTEI